LVVHGQGEEVEARLGLVLGDDRRQDRGLAVGDQGRTVGLTGHAAGFDGQLAAAPVDGFSLDVEHSCFVSLMSKGRIPLGADRAVSSLSNEKQRRAEGPLQSTGGMRTAFEPSRTYWPVSA